MLQSLPNIDQGISSDKMRKRTDKDAEVPQGDQDMIVAKNGTFLSK